jgi:hypothetical protein
VDRLKSHLREELKIARKYSLNEDENAVLRMLSTELSTGRLKKGRKL